MIQQIKERADKATIGPWAVYENYENGIEICDGETRRSWSSINAYDDPKQITDNAEFIASARTDVPALCNALAIAVKALEDYNLRPQSSRRNFTADKALAQIEPALKSVR